MITLGLPLPPNMANTRGHGASTSWRPKHKARKAYLAECDTLQLTNRVPPPPTAPLSGVVLAFTLYLHSPMDDDNALARVKWACDWLRTRGYLVDDKRAHCRMTIPLQLIDRANPRLAITIHTADEAHTA